MIQHFHNARLINPEAGTDTTGSLTVADGVIVAMDDAAPEGAVLTDCGGHCLAPGIVDWGVKIGEPGERHKESFRSAGLAAAAGGVTTIIARPDTAPAIDTPEVLEFVTRRAAESPVRIRHMAALTKGRAGHEMTEIGFLLDAGAIAFSDVYNVSTDTKALARALTYARSLGALVIGHPQEPGLSAGAATTSGKFASLRGLPAVSPMAERIGLDRDLGLVEMTGARYHADQITTARSLPPLERAKKNGLDVTAGVSIHHLTLNELDVGDYRTFFKLSPPLRAEADRRACIEAVRDGTIDVICSAHDPRGPEVKRLPFADAAPGMAGAETLLPMVLSLVRDGVIDMPRAFDLMAGAPARLLGVAAGVLAAGMEADVALVDAEKPWLVDARKMEAQAGNTPFDRQPVQGRVTALWKGGAPIAV